MFGLVCSMGPAESAMGNVIGLFICAMGVCCC